MYTGNELKVGKRFIMEGIPFEVTSYAQKVMGRWGSIINVKARNLISGANISKTFSDSDKFEPANILTSNYNFLYFDNEGYYFMHQENFEQVVLSKEVLDGAEMFLQEGDTVRLQEFNGNPINIELEPTTVLEVMDTPPWERWDTATGGKKPATLSTGLVVQVPLFINIGDKLIIDTRTKEYKSRA